MDSESVILEFSFRYYLSLSSNGVQRAGDRALLISKEMEGGVGGEGEMCLSFWYYMHEPIVDNTGPNLGKLSAWVRSVHLRTTLLYSVFISTSDSFLEPSEGFINLVS